MGTIHVCDGCGEEFRDEDDLTVVHIKKGDKYSMAQRCASKELCDECDPDGLVEHLTGRLNLWLDETLTGDE